MGGNAIAKARRVTKEEYDKIIAHIEGQGFYTTLISGYKTFYGEVVKSYRNKQDFGDIDVVIDDRVDVVPIFAHFRPKKCAVNGHVFSFAYDSIQVDFIRVPKEDIRSTLDYFAYNDLGNLLGKIARAIGLKYGSKGLMYQYKEGDNVIEDIIITKNLDEILTHLGLDPQRYHQGFDELEDIFKYVISSKWFDKHLYQPENATQQNRIRDMKRKTYLTFLEWMKTLPDWIRNLPILICEEYKRVIEQYPHVQNRIKELDASRAKDKAFRARFNGEVVSQLTGLEGAALGKFMSWFRQGNTDSFLMGLDDEKLHVAILMGYRQYSQ
jgi:hypothetical protein